MHYNPHTIVATSLHDFKYWRHASLSIIDEGLLVSY